MTVPNGLIPREEQVYNADNSGYINYYLREGKRLRRFQGLFSGRNRPPTIPFKGAWG